MSSPDPSAANDLESPAATRRSRPRWQLFLVLAAVAGIAFSTTACEPEQSPREAVREVWGGNSNCADRIVTRESGYNPDAVNSSSGATGLFQLMPSHAKWIKAELGYDWSEMKDPYKNARAAKALSSKAYSYWGDGWQPWRLSGRAAPGGGCPA